MIYLVDLEYVESRYTAQWKTEFPLLLAREGFDVSVIDGPENIAQCTTPGAFLNFSGTNIYKSEQVKKISELFSDNKIKDGDHFIFADAWHPGVINLKYMSELLGVDVSIHGLWHAGSYDSQDFLGRIIGDAEWVRNAEKSFYHCYDYNWFASDFHIKLFSETFLNDSRSYRTGWPMDYLDNEINKESCGVKEDIILFPHRVAPEKQPSIFKALSKELPEYEFVTCQEHNLSKKEYHSLLNKSKIVFSANLQETLGIGCYEALCAGAIPLVPDRLSYTEMYVDRFKYDSSWTEDQNSFEHNKGRLVNKIRTLMEEFNENATQSDIYTNRNYLHSEYFSANGLVEKLKEVI